MNTRCAVRHFFLVRWFRAYYQDAAILRTEEDSAVLYSVLAPVGGLPWAERKLMIDEMGDAASKVHSSLYLRA